MQHIYRKKTPNQIKKKKLQKEDTDEHLRKIDGKCDFFYSYIDMAKYNNSDNLKPLKVGNVT